MKPSEILYAAADYIREHGWRRGSIGNHGGPRCMLGAIESVEHHDNHAHFRAWCQLEQTVTAGCFISTFNDKHCKTADDAIAALEIAADIAAAEGK